MLGIMLQKMWHKKWMNLSLLLGCILLVATAVCFPLYQEAAYNRMLQDEFKHYVESTGKWPTSINMTIVSKKEKGGTTISNAEKLAGKLIADLRVREKETISYYYVAKSGVHSLTNRKDADELYARLGMKTNLENHSRILSGDYYSDLGVTEDGLIEVVMSQSCMVKQGYLVGETISFDAFKDADGNIIQMYIKGVFAEDNDNYYWYESSDEFDNVLFMNPELFKSMFTGENAAKFTVTCNFDVSFYYDDISADDVAYITERTDYYTNKSGFRSVISTPGYAEVIDSYNNKHSRISATLAILQVPVMIMLAAFLFMISGQMYEMERNEISVIKSRGSSRGQIFRLYLYQGLVLVIGGAIAGLPLGMAMSRLLGSTRNFLVFDFSESLDVKMGKLAFIYMGAAMLLGLICLTVPAIRHSRVSIVNLKQQKAMKKKSLWEKLFVDVILLAVAGYGYYSFNHNSADLAEAVLKGESLDPLLYLSSSLMIVGAGLLALRIQPYILKLIFIIGKKRWKPASFVSFMDNVKNGRKQQLIMLFLIMTISLGMYHTTVARTIVENSMRNTEYLGGSDVIMKEVWIATVDKEGALTGEYAEPDYDKYMTSPIFKSHTKVYNDTSAYISTSKNARISIELLGINTKQFGEITWVDYYLNNEHYYNYLNSLAVVENGLLVSANFRDVLGYKEGDTIEYTNFAGKSTSGVIVDFVNYWPTYSPTVKSLSPDGSFASEDKYLVIANYDYMRNKLGNYPYEIWASLNSDVTEKDIYAWIQENDVRLTKYSNKIVDLEDTENDPLLQGTNGVLTLGFVVTIILCGVGYLIYWIMSIKERELVFGVLRASGFHKGELFHMLINEQIFCGLYSVVAGFGIGYLASRLYVPILQKAYASINQVLPLELITNPTDIQRLLLVVGSVVIVCLAVLTVMIMRMNVAKALKLGEE